MKDRKNDVLKWGDEVEYHLFKEDKDTNTVKLNCVAAELMQKLNDEDAESAKQGKEVLCTWHPEWGAWMVEATPARYNLLLISWRVET